MKNMLLKPF